MELNTREYGAGETPLIVLHGLFGSGDNWHTIARRLESKRKIITADLRNHGGSPHSDVFTFPAMAGDVAELLEHGERIPADILGHSLGGKVGMELALSRPDLVRRLIVVDIAPKRYRPHNIELRDAMLSLDLDRISSRREAEQELSARVPERAVQLFLLKNLVHLDGGGFRWRLNLDGITRSFESTGEPIAPGRRFEGPVLFLYGARSDYLDPATDGEYIADLFPRAEIRRVENATHWVHADQPDRVIAEVERFLSA